MEKAMRTDRDSPAAQADADDVDLALKDLRSGRVAGAAFAGCPPNPPPRESDGVKVSLADAAQIIFATVSRTGDPQKG
jgi:hypothetical protein